MLPAQITKNSKGFLAKTKGYALIEILLAFGLAVIIITAMVSLAIVTVRAATTNNAYAEAGKVAQSQAERLKLLRDTSTWTTFTNAISGGCGSSCHIVSSAGVLSFVAGTGMTASNVTYSLTTIPANPTSLNKEIKYTVVANWNISDVVKIYKIEGLLSDWQSI